MKDEGDSVVKGTGIDSETRTDKRQHRNHMLLQPGREDNVLEQQEVMQHDHNTSFVQKARERETVSCCMIDSRMSGVMLCIDNKKKCQLSTKILIN